MHLAGGFYIRNNSCSNCVHHYRNKE